MSKFHQELATVLSQRMRSMGVELPRETLRPPALPDGWGFNLSQNGHPHRCESEPLVELPLVLVADISVPCYDNDSPGGPITIRAKERFAPYWLVGARLIHDWVPYPEEPYRPVSPIEAACIFLQHPHLGSVKGHLGNHWGHGSIQAYWCPDYQRVVMSKYGLVSYNHHATFARYSIRFDCPETASYAPPAPAAAPASPPAGEGKTDSHILLDLDLGDGGGSMPPS